MRCGWCSCEGIDGCVGWGEYEDGIGDRGGGDFDGSEVGEG